MQLFVFRRVDIVDAASKHGPWTARALQLIADQGLSVTKIEGHPIKGKPFEYRFVVETVAPDGRPIDAALFQGLAAKTEWFALLGVYDPST